jgi:hypothetical protein
MEERVYIKGRSPGLKGIGARIIAARTQGDVLAGQTYTIKGFVNYDGTCARTMRVILEEVNGDYAPKMFRIN